MSANIKLVEQPKQQLSMHPKKFAMWLFLVTVLMVFASLTSAYMVKKGDGNWRVFDLPQMFYISSIIILISSVTLHMAYRAAKSDNFVNLKSLITITLVLGFAFLVSQFYAWAELVENNVYLTGGNPSESFVYVLSGVHWLHIVGGVIFGLIVMVRSFQLKINSKDMLQIELFATFWHALGFFWIYLLVFLLFNYQ